jgi:hypothetical protein
MLRTGHAADTFRQLPFCALRMTKDVQENAAAVGFLLHNQRRSPRPTGIRFARRSDVPIRSASIRRSRGREHQLPLDFQFRNPLAVIEAFVPAWLQIVVFGYLGIVLMQWAMERLSERRGLFLFVIYLAAAVFFTVRAVFLLTAQF